MAYFQAVGTIATDIIRKETRKGILASFRLKSGTPGRGQLWITVETWGHTAGVLNTHASVGRGIIVSGRLKQNIWSDTTTSQRKTRLVVVAHNLDFCDPNHDITSVSLVNQVTAVGRVKAAPRPDHTGDRLLFNIISGQAGAKTGRLCLQVEARGQNMTVARQLRPGVHVAVGGRLGYRTRPTPHGEKKSGYELAAYTLAAIVATQPSQADLGPRTAQNESVQPLHHALLPATSFDPETPKVQS